MDAAAIARPYAAAAFAVARDTDGIAQWLCAINAMSAAMSALEQGGALVSSAQAAEVALAAAQQAESLDGDTGAAVKRFVEQLQLNDRLFALPAIAARFDKLRRDHQGVVAARIETAMSIADTKSFDRALEQRLGKKVESTYVINIRLLCGARVFVDDYVIDGSLRGKMDKLAAALGGRGDVKVKLA